MSHIPTKRRTKRPAKRASQPPCRGKRCSPARGYFLLLFIAAVTALWLIHRHYPHLTSWHYWFADTKAGTLTGDSAIIAHHERMVQKLATPRIAPAVASEPPARPRSLVDLPYVTLFADKNPVQQPVAMTLGVPEAGTRQELRQHYDLLENISTNAYFAVARLTHSVPMVTPHTARVLERIGQNFADSLHCKGLPPHHFIISSITRTREDVNKLKRGNGNASDNSCHFHGTTVDIAYNKYERCKISDGLLAAEIPSGKLKAVLGEVLRDMRNEGYIYVLYEVKQPCFHITVR